MKSDQSADQPAGNKDEKGTCQGNAHLAFTQLKIDVARQPPQSEFGEPGNRCHQNDEQYKNRKNPAHPRIVRLDIMTFETELRDTCFRLTLTDYRVKAQIGALTWEHGRTQPVILTIDAWVKKTLSDDRLNVAFDYRALPEAVDAVIASGHIELQETLVERVAEKLLSDPRLEAVRVQSTKPEAYPGSSGISVETFRRQNPVRPHLSSGSFPH